MLSGYHKGQSRHRRCPPTQGAPSAASRLCRQRHRVQKVFLKDVVCVDTMEYYSAIKRKEIFAICNNTDELAGQVT